MKSIFKVMIGVILVVVSMMAVSYLQHRFDNSDTKHALQAVRATRSLGTEDTTLEEKLVKRFSVSPQQIQWVPNIESKVRGTVKIEAQVPGVSEQFVWMVDLIRFNVTPLTPAAIALGKGS